MNEYQKQAIDFLTKTGATMDIIKTGHGLYFEDDKQERDIYQITIKRDKRQYSFPFGQSIAKSGIYRDKVTKKEYYPDGSPVNPYGNKKVSPSFLSDFCVFIPGKAPSEYNVLAALTKYEPGTFEDFCSDYGYDSDSRKAEKVYKAVVKELKALQTLFSDEELEEMQEIN